MLVKKHPTGGYRAYKKIGRVEHQLYSNDVVEANTMQAELDAKSNLHASLKPQKLFSKCGRLVHLRVRKYKKTNKPTFQLQVLKGSKQVKTEKIYKGCFNSSWKVFFKLWRVHFGLSMIDVFEEKERFITAKRLYMKDIYNIENQH